MKAKVKIDAQQIKGMLIQHVEKIVFGVFVLIFVVLCYGAVGKERYQKTPADLDRDTKALVAKMETSVFTKDDLPIKVTDPTDRIAAVSGPIDVASIFPRPPVFD